jgi:leader peptidase (prepilin peptidase)/N-methyltransferase
MLTIAAIASYVIAGCLLAALAAYDYKYYLLPDKMNAGLAGAFIIFHFSTHWMLITPLEALGGLGAGGGLLLLIRAAANHFYKEDALGLGDVKLMAAAGLGLGFPNIMLALSLGAGFGMLHGIFMGLRQKKAGAKVDFGRVNVPAGPGLCLGIALVMMAQFGMEWMK